MIDQLIDWLGVQDVVEKDQITITVDAENVLDVAHTLKTHPDLKMEALLDLCGVDYLHYGVSEWEVQQTSYGRAQLSLNQPSKFEGPRFVVVCHLLSYTHGHRMRLCVHLGDDLCMPSLTDLWASSNWYEREAYDLFGIQFSNHPDLRRILTDYGFRGYPFRKDFPLVGEVEMSYDGKLARCVYEKNTLENRVGVPKVIREDHRYWGEADAT